MSEAGLLPLYFFVPKNQTVMTSGTLMRITVKINPRLLRIQTIMTLLVCEYHLNPPPPDPLLEKGGGVIKL
jgi:hypothetical protein